MLVCLVITTDDKVKRHSDILVCTDNSLVSDEVGDLITYLHTISKDYLFKGLLHQVLPCYVAEIAYHRYIHHHVPYSAPSTPIPTYQQGTTSDLGKRVVFFARLLLLIFLYWVFKLSLQVQVTTLSVVGRHFNLTVQNITLPTLPEVAQPQDTYCSCLLDCRDG
jgi:hypothetical protein